MSLTAAPRAESVDPADPAEKKRLRRTFGAFPTGVTVLTTGGDVPRGMTANSFTSVSLDPPMVLVCVNKDAVMYQHMESSSAFAVSVLGAEQEAVARYFADRSRPTGADQFEAVDWTAGPAAGTPLIDGAVAHLECRKWRTYDGGDHMIFLGRVLAAVRSPGQESLLFHDGQFRLLAPRDSEGGAA